MLDLSTLLPLPLPLRSPLVLLPIHSDTMTVVHFVADHYCDSDFDYNLLAHDPDLDPDPDLNSDPDPVPDLDLSSDR